MSIFKKRKGEQIMLDVISGTAARAVYQGHDQTPNLEFRFQTREGNITHEVVIEMDLISATKFLNSALAAHSICAPQIQHINRPIGY